MFNIQRSATILVLASLLAACGSGGNNEERAPPPPRQDTAQQEMFRPLEKARAVEDTTMQHKRDMDKAIDANEGSPDQ
jgi:hypothetical protein